MFYWAPRYNDRAGGCNTAVPNPDANQAQAPGNDAAPTPGSRFRRRRSLTLRTRLLLLVVASVVPLVGMGVIREYLDYAAERRAVFDGLIGSARGLAAALERDLQLRISSLETLATSPALRVDDVSQFDQQAAAFLARLPAGSFLGLTTPDLQIQRLYGRPDNRPEVLPRPDTRVIARQIFDFGRPVVTDMHFGSLTGTLGFSVDVPVIRDGRVIYDLFIGLAPAVVAGLIQRQYAPPRSVMTVVDASGNVVARIPHVDRFIGGPIMPGLWSEVQAHPEGITTVQTLDGMDAVATYTHIVPFNWTVVVGAPEEVVFAPMRAAIVRVGGVGAVVLLAGLGLAMLAARGIMRPIEHLRRLAAHDDRIGPLGRAGTGLPETDTVARALTAAASERQESARALAESESRFRALFERSASGTILIDPETTRIIDCNEVAASIAGYTVDEFRTHAMTDFSLQTSPDRIREICRSVGDGANLRYETRIQGRQGQRDLLVAVAPVQLAGRTLVLLNQIDITDLRRAEAGLRSNEERLELARQGASLGIWDWDLANDTLSWSEHQWFLHGLDPRQGGPSPEVWRRVVHPADLHRTQRELIAALKSPDHPYATEYSVVLPDGSLRRLLGRGQTIRGPDGRVARMVGINMDVTARYEAEMARDRLIWMLETERGRLSEIIEALPLGVGIVDTTGRIIMGNALMQRLNGPVIQSMTVAPRGEWIAWNPDGSRLAPEDYPIRRALRLGQTSLPGVEFLFRDLDGSETWFRVSSTPLRRHDGQTQEALGIFQDIDAEKRLLDIQQQINARLEQRMREEIAAREAAQKRAAHAERMHALGQIAGGIAHDFNNVLQAVSGGAALIERRPDDSERVLRNARMVMDAAKRGAAITSRLLAFSRRGDLRAENVDAAALLTDMAEVLTHTLGGSVVCMVEVAFGLPPLFADRGQLETVLVNLAANSRDAMPSGGTLTLGADSELVSTALPHPAGLAPGRYVRISVSDTGTGMDQAVLSRVTEPFFTTKEPGKGTGLGLAMAKGFVEQSGGSLSIDSVANHGTRIILWLPAATGTVAQTLGSLADQGAGSGKPCVLLVDDDPIVRDVLRLSLEDAAYTVHTAESGAAALAWLEAGQPMDIIVSDLTMPGMDGLALIRAMQERRPNLPAILLSGYVGDGAALAIGGALSGTFSLLRKPVSGTQLADRISALLASTMQPSRASSRRQDPATR
jgi:PAS domain S-box-containing protein